MAFARQLTAAGIGEARRFLAAVRAEPAAEHEAPHSLLFGRRTSAEFDGAPEVEPVAFESRREAHEYLAPLLAPISHRVADHPGFWSWLGMFYFNETAPRRGGEFDLSPRDEAFVVYDEGQSYQRRYVHYLWTAWRLGEQHPNADFLLEQPLQAMGDIADRVFSYPRIFNSPGVTDLILNLYTERGRQKRKFGRSRGGLRHLIRTLDQLDCTYDVYGMTADALRRILPADFHRWYPAAT